MIRAAGFFDTDLNISKNIHVNDRVTLVGGASAFNILNHPNFDMPINNVSSGAFGFVRATVSPVTSPYGVATPLTGHVIQLNAQLSF